MIKRLNRRWSNSDSGGGERGQRREEAKSQTNQQPTSPDAPHSPRRSLRTHKSSKVMAIALRPQPHIDMQIDEPTNSGTQHEGASKVTIQETGTDQSYLQQREQLLTDEERHSWDGPARSRASHLQHRANTVVRRVREEERTDLFGNLPGEAIPGPDTRDLGGRYLINHDRIKESRLFKIAFKIPKGAHLHLHFNSELPPELLLEIAKDEKNPATMFIRADRALVDRRAFEDAEIAFGVLPKDTVTSDLLAKDYDPNFKVDGARSWMLWDVFRQKWEEHPPFQFQSTVASELSEPEKWANEKMVMTVDLKYKKAQTHNELWACFNQSTRAFKGLVNYEYVYRKYIVKAIESMIEHKIMYAELRPMLLDKTIPKDDGIGQLDHKAQMSIILEVVGRKQDELRAKGQHDLFPFGIRIIYCTPRSIPRSRMKTELEDCINLALQFKEHNLICGFDLVGAEDRPNNVGFYADLLLDFKRTCADLKIHIPFMFHAGETLLDTGGTVDPKNSNLYDSLLLGAARIGHGYAIMKHPMLVEKYRESHIALELCPISNELLGLCGNAREHPYPALLAAGLHCTLNADNPSLFRSSLSHEFYQVMVGDPRMSLHGWKQLAEWSLLHARLDRTQWLHGLKLLRHDWEMYCKDIVKKYGTDEEKAAEEAFGDEGFIGEATAEEVKEWDQIHWASKVQS